VFATRRLSAPSSYADIVRERSNWSEAGYVHPGIVPPKARTPFTMGNLQGSEGKGSKSSTGKSPAKSRKKVKAPAPPPPRVAPPPQHAERSLAAPAGRPTMTEGNGTAEAGSTHTESASAAAAVPAQPASSTYAGAALQCSLRSSFESVLSEPFLTPLGNFEVSGCGGVAGSPPASLTPTASGYGTPTNRTLTPTDRQRQSTDDDEPTLTDGDDSSSEWSAMLAARRSQSQSLRLDADDDSAMAAAPRSKVTTQQRRSQAASPYYYQSKGIVWFSRKKALPLGNAWTTTSFHD